MANGDHPPDERLARERAIAAAFSPHAPINTAGLFRGRVAQVRDVLDTMSSEGLHAVIYGERGVGKTSLANIIRDYIADQVSVARVNCSQDDVFSRVVLRALGSIQLSIQQPAVGFPGAGQHTSLDSLASFVQAENAGPDEIAALLARLPLRLVLIFDEFDRLKSTETAPFADLIKALSDRGAPVTVILVGVAEDVNTLLGSHASVVRNLRQIPLPRMSDEELGEILDQGLAAAGFSFESSTPRARIISVSQGFPHYTHLLALYATRYALDQGRTVVSDRDVLAGMLRAVESADQSNRDLYYRAATGTRRNSIWGEVVAACAMAHTDDRGYFSTADVQDEVANILGRPVKQQAVAYHLGKLTESDHGPLLERVGPARRYRYRFVNSLMKPFILMKAMNDGLIEP